jgi:hypothetical protein
MPLSLKNGLFLSVAGTLGKNHEIPVSDLVKVLTEFEKVVSSIAAAGSHPPVKLSLRGFHAGSAIMELGSSLSEPSFFDNPQQEEWFEHALESVFEVASFGEYLRLNELFNQPQVRKDLAQSLYGLTSAVGDSPLSLVEPTEKRGHFREKYAIRVFKKHMLDHFIDQEVTPEIVQEPTVAYGVARVKQKTSKKGQVRQELVDVMYDPEVKFSRSFTQLKSESNTFTFFDPLTCVFEHNKDGFLMENEELGLVATGDTMDELIVHFANEFDHVYHRLSEFADDRLSTRLQRVKKRMALMIKTIS